MSLPVALNESLKPLSANDVSKIERVTKWMQQREAVQMPVDHLLHAGMYTRTVCVPAGVAAVGVAIKRNTVLIVSGRASFYRGDKPLDIDGFAVIPGLANRKAFIYAHSDTFLTMTLPCDAKTVDEAERWFTDEYERLASCSEDTVRITGE